MKRLIFIFYTSCFLTGAQNSTEFDKGNALYNEGNYKAAIQAYEVILENGFALCRTVLQFGELLLQTK